MTTYTYPLINVGADQIIAQVIRMSEKLDAEGHPQLASDARRAIIRHRDELNAIAVEIARIGHKEIVEEERASRVRPDTMGQGGPRLEDFIGISAPIPRALGSVGLNDEEALVAGGVGWWFTNEYGYSGHVGREVHGFFEPGRSVPGAAPPGTHPLFAPTGPKGPKMTIEEPIPSREFVKHGGQTAEHEWHARLRASRERMKDAVLRATLAAQRTPPTAPPKRGAGRRRRP